MKELLVYGKAIDLRSDHLKAVFEYALEQMMTSEIKVLSFGDNENALMLDAQIDYVKECIDKLEELTAAGNQDLLVVAADDMTLSYYNKEQYKIGNDLELEVDDNE